ncbi:MAG: elongation factor 4 [Parcubacteria group bacterium]|nr:elongation factor 4 [Parcubacteria group bacterium]
MSNICNFVIIAHIDHGKSTLADRFLEMTGTISKENIQEQHLDSMDLEKEKGITIKMHPVRILFSDEGKDYILNLVDTPGHIDFSYEISRALACVEGALLLVDAVKGIQAQTVFNLHQAQAQGLKIIAAVNKVDLPQAQTEQTKKEIAVVLGVDVNEIFSISAKTGEGVDDLLRSIVKQVPPPKSEGTSTQRALVFDSKYDSFSGVIAFVRVFNGEFKKGDKIKLLAANTSTEIKEVGYFNPALKPSDVLKVGEIGYIKTGIKEPLKVRAGDTISDTMDCTPLQGYKEPQAVLFLSLFPENADNFELLKDGLEKLKLNDAALDYMPESKTALGRGFRIGFLGSLHAEITIRRLKAEFDLDLIATSPQVMFQVSTKKDKDVFISSPSEWPDPAEIEEVKEPWVVLEIVTPNTYMGQVMQVLQSFNAQLTDTQSVTADKSILLAEAPLRQVVSGNFYDKIKSATHGYASFSFEPIEYRKGDLVKLDILVAGKQEEPFSRITARKDAFYEGRKFLVKLKEALPKQQFSVALQAVISGKVIARETISARRKDVTGALYGGDVTRKNKLLEKQKKGKKALKARGKVNISANDFLEILKEI